MITLNGLILLEKDIGESSKSITVLTAEKGVINIFVRGGRKSKKTTFSTQIFSFSKLCFEQKKNSKGQLNYFLNSSESIKIFYDLRLDAKRMALASYFAELLRYTGIESSECNEVLRLTLNSFYFLNEGKKDMEQLKSIFEMRLLCEIGLRPNLIGCSKCYVYESDEMYFDFLNNNLECSECCSNVDSMHKCRLDKTLLYIIRFISLTDYDRLFSFRISKKYQRKLTAFTERFVTYNLKPNFSTLDFYKHL